jgi:hypothetical protein
MEWRQKACYFRNRIDILLIDKPSCARPLDALFSLLILRCVVICHMAIFARVLTA